MKKTVIVSLVCCFVPPAFANEPDWTLLSRDDGVAVSIDPSSYARNGKSATVRARLDYEVPNARPGIPFLVTAQVSQWSFDCETRRGTMGQSTSYGTQPDQVSTSLNDSEPYTGIKPGSHGDIVMSYACNRTMKSTSYLTTPDNVCRIPAPTYPSLARRRNHEGTTVVAYTVTTSNEISNIEIVSRSGHDELDAAAVDSIKGAVCEHAGGTGNSRRTQSFNFSIPDSPATVTYSEDSKIALGLLEDPARHPVNEGVGNALRVNIPLCDVRHVPNQNAPIFKKYPQGKVLTVFERKHEFARVSPDGTEPEWVVFSLLQQ
jgi:TonB family protein